MQPKVSSSLRAITPCQIVRIPHDGLRELIDQFPGIMEAFWRYTVWDAAVATEWVVNVGKRTGPERLAHLLCEMAVRSGEVSAEPFSFNLPLTQTVLAEASGLSSVHINRTLQGLRQKNLVQFEKGQVSVPDWKLLTEAADFDASYMRPEKPLRFTAAAPAKEDGQEPPNVGAGGVTAPPRSEGSEERR